MAPISLLTAVDSTSHIHLVVGSNPLAAARCAKSLEVGAKPLLIALESADLHYSLQKRINSGEVEWLKKSFEDEDVLRLGREEVNGVVDAVFVTLGQRDPLSKLLTDPGSVLLTVNRRAHISNLQTKSNTSQRSRRSITMHLQPVINTHRRAPADRRHDEWPRLQAFLSNPTRSRLSAPSTTRFSMCASWDNSETNTRGRSYLPSRTGR